ncbi:hypothetical protein [Cardinium endosymbiont of Nabis limbatus]|uniref:hypothetical protein n=1 Tax=Cardinium endosymbiont of Nabis limbatus TaxID=3066217 RepID=UPI003AF3ADE8
MKKKIIPLLLFFIASHVTHAVAPGHADAPVLDAQENQSDTYLPSVENYSSFSFEFLKMDYLYNMGKVPSDFLHFHNMKKFDWHGLLRGNGTFVHAIRINQSRFAFCLGIGWSTLYYAFAGQKDNDEVTYPRLKRGESKTDCEEVKNEDAKKVSYSAVKIPFIDLLFRLRFNSVLEDPKAGFHTWLGLKVGFRQRATQVMNYKEYDDSGASSIHNSYFNLKLLACGLQAGVGYGRFGLTGGFNLTSLFKEKKGPDYSDSLRPFSFSVYVDLI